MSKGTSGDVFAGAVLETPCRHCKVLELNDLEHGGTVQASSGGTRFVSFGEVQETFIDRMGPDSMITQRIHRRDPETSTRVRSYPKVELKLGYRRQDALPDMPGLAATALQGCEFCSMLREDLASVFREGTTTYKSPADETSAGTRLSIDEVTYQYRDEPRPKRPKGNEESSGQPWLDTLLVYFTVDSGNKKGEHSLHYNFHAFDTGKKDDARGDLETCLPRVDACASWLNIWRRPFWSEDMSTTRLRRLRNLVESSLVEVPPSKDAYLPTRLIDVGPTASDNPRLVISDQYPPLLGDDDHAKKYVALSYCWGKKEDAEKQLKTTNATLKDHLERLELHRLPRTIADAIEITRLIGLRYIWVDALCIIQGDKDDWEREAFEMSNVYTNSFLTICALRGSSCMSGFLERDNDRSRALRINFRSTLDPSVSGSVYLRMLKEPHWNLKDANKLWGRATSDIDTPADYDIDDAAWSTRGWTFQEAQLSPRKVYFGDYMLHMSCGALQESEDGSEFHDSNQNRSLPLAWVQERPDAREVLAHWYMLARRFSGRKLSYAQDTLPAISAFARIVSSAFPDHHYIAGLWESDLQSGLLWTSNAWKPAEQYIEELSNNYTAPSWSWACHRHVLVWVWGVGDTSYTFAPEFKLSRADIMTSSVNPYGEVYGGQLLVSAKAVKLPRQDNGPPNVVAAPHPEYIWLGIIFHYTLRSEQDEYIAHFHLDWDFYGAQRSEGHPNGPIDRLWMVLISSSNLDAAGMKSRPYLTSSDIMLGLLVLETDNKDGFQKVGLFYSENRGLGGKRFWDGIETSEIKLI